MHSRCARGAPGIATRDSEMKAFDCGTSHNGAEYTSTGQVGVINPKDDVEDSRGADQADESGLATSSQPGQSGRSRHRFEDYAEAFVRIAAIQRKQRRRWWSFVKNLIRKIG